MEGYGGAAAPAPPPDDPTSIIQACEAAIAEASGKASFTQFLSSLDMQRGGPCTAVWTQVGVV